MTSLVEWVTMRNTDVTNGMNVHHDGVDGKSKPRTSLFPFRSSFLCHCMICKYVQILQCLASKQTNLHNPLFDLHFEGQTYSSSASIACNSMFDQ